MTRERTAAPAWLRLLVIGTALALSLAALAEFGSWRRVQKRLDTLLELGDAVARSPGAASDVRREPDPTGAELRAARLIVADELDQTWRARLSPADRRESQRRGSDRLAAAEEIALRALATRPASWQAAMILGAARYLSAVREGRAAGALETAAWEAPLELAEALGPGRAEPIRFRAAAALSNWARLSAASRQRAIELLERAFEDRTTLALLLEPWMRLAPSEEIALETVPDRVQTWILLENLYSRRDDWERFASIRGRRVGAHRREAELRVEEAELRLAGGDVAAGRALLLQVLNEIPPGTRYAPTLEKTLKLLPAGSLGRWQSSRILAWFAWARERCLLAECPLSPPTVRRIAGAESLQAIPDRAVAAMMAGDVGRAESLADHGDSALLPHWAPYLLLRARHLARAGDLGPARAALQKVHRSWHATAAYRAALRSVGASRGGAPQGPPGPPVPTLWSSGDWLRSGAVSRLELEIASACGGLRIEMSGRGGGSAVEARWNGDPIDWFAVDSATRRDLEREIRPGFHVLEVVTIGGDRAAPGRVALRRCPA